MTLVFKVVLVLMPLKLLQVEQNKMINKKLSNSYTIVLNSDNNRKNIKYKIIRGHYTYIFISPEIVLSKKFKKNLFDYYFFANWLYLLAVNQIHL